MGPHAMIVAWADNLRFISRQELTLANRLGAAERIVKEATCLSAIHKGIIL